MANKYKKMLKVFFGVMTGNERIINLTLPNSHKPDVYTINYGELKRLGLVNLIFDVDNTITPVNDESVSKELGDLFTKLKEQGFNIILVSNHNEFRVKPVADSLGVKYLAKANKPSREGFDKALKALGSKKKNTVMIGDQMLTDVYGGNKYGLYTIMVDPVANHYDIKTGTARILQNIMMRTRLKKHLNKK